MKNILILHPYRENYTDILSCLPTNHHFTLLIDESKRESFRVKLPKNVKLAGVAGDQNTRREKAEKLLKSESFDAIIPLDEFDILLAAELREKFHIGGQKVDEAIIFRDKNVMTKRVKELGVRIPESQKIDCFSELQYFFDRHQDIILKPLSGAGSVDTFRVQTINDLVKLKESLFNQGEQILVQEYIESDIYHIDGFVSNGEIIYCEPSKYLYNPLLIKQGGSAAAVSLDKDSTGYKELVGYAIFLSSKLDLQGTYLFHLEVFYDLKDIIFLEIACRIGGARIRQNLEYKFGCNPLKLLIYSISGEILPELPKEFPNTGWLLTAKRAGTIKELPTITNEIKQQFSIFDYIEYVKVGQNLNSAFHSADAVIGLSLYGKDFKKTEQALLSIEKWILQHTRYN